MPNEQSASGAQVPCISLLCCPSCMFDDAAYAEHAIRMRGTASPKDTYMPKLYKDRFLNKWVIECQNCGMEVVFNSDTEADHAKLWNELPRKHNASGERPETRSEDV
jgi:hypothetical protein